MLFSKTAVSGLLCFAAAAWSSPLVPLVPNLEQAIAHELHARQAAGFIPITGAQTGRLVNRPECRELEADPDRFNIFLLGLSRMQTQSQDNPLSYYQIAGIHGRPFGTWGNVQPGPGLQNNGYCTHSSNLFGTWHRPYLALFDQSLLINMFDAVREFPVGPLRNRYANAAMNVRMCYYDWAVRPGPGRNSVPMSFTTRGISVVTPAGTRTIFNPLYSYRFHPVGNLGGRQFSVWQETLRYPTNADSPSAQTRNELMVQVMNVEQPRNRVRLYDLFTLRTTFSSFTYNAAGTRGDSLEALHGNIHNFLAGGGHLAYLDTASFDPLFMAHHAMVDRCVAIFQALRPNTYVERASQPMSTYTIPRGSQQDANSPLTPFARDRQGAMHTSNGVRNHRIFGYEYSILANSPSTATLNNAINALYGPAATRTAKRDLESDANLLNGPLEEKYFADIKSERFGLGTSYTIALFLGEHGNEPTLWPLDPNYIGSHSVLAHNEGEKMDGDIVTGSIDLTATLKKFVGSGLASLAEPDVVAFLKEKLKWAVGSEAGVVDLATLPSLVVSVGSHVVSRPASAEELPKVAGKKKNFIAVTKEKESGAKSKEDSKVPKVDGIPQEDEEDDEVIE